MEEEVYLDEGKIKAIVEKLKGSSEALEEKKVQLDRILQNVNEAWEGSDATQYTKNMKDNYASLLQGFIEVLNSFIEYLNGINGIYGNFDEEYQSKGVDF
mgnify:CR=1 FL=1